MAAASSSGDIPRKYDVFISFRGEDTRKGFTNTLFHSLKNKGIDTFIDDGLPRGQQIEASLIKTIEESMIAVVVFSKNYASSSWCLDELVKIREFNLVIMPIFYDVKPDQVLELSGEFGKEFAKLKTPENEVKIKQWSNDLAFVATQAGWDLNNYSTEIDVIEKVTAYIVEYLKSRVVPTCSSEFIGIDSLVNELQTLLTNGSSGVKSLGLWGMGGIGKTTIAEVLYRRLSQQFDDRYFCSLPLHVKDPRKFVHLRNKMISHFLKEKYDERTPHQPCDDVVRRLRKIVLDNVSTDDQVKISVGPEANRWFASESKIIVTSRDSKVLQNEDMTIREIEGMSRDFSRRLSCLHAFKQSQPLIDEDYIQFSNREIDYTKGLPLALKVLGRVLRGSPKDQWKSTLETLETREHPMDANIEEVLMISYNNLSEIEKERFLDIACFFKGYDRDWVKDILGGITHLIDKYLVTVNPDNTLGMHDLLQKMGQDIVEKQSRSGMRRRIRRSCDSYRLLVNYEEALKATEIEGIFLNMEDDGIKKLNLHPKIFSKMHNLKVLVIVDFPEHESKIKIEIDLNESPEDFYADGGIQFLPDDLRVLCWDHYTGEILPSNFSAKNLVILNMMGSKLRRLWKENKHFVNLKVLDLSYSYYFTTLPDLTSAAKLEEIILDECDNLLEIPASIQHLQSLSILSLSCCIRLCDLPSLANISTLRKLNLEGCKGLKEFPATSKAIEELILLGMSVVQWPDSMSCLDNLKVLELPSELQKLPSTLQLKSLEKLALYSGKIQVFPEIIGQLRKIDLIRCDLLEALPINFGQLNCLEELRLSHCKVILKGPPTLTGLNSIKRLYLNDCRAEEFPLWVCTLSSLQLLDLSHNDFVSVPNSIRQLSLLKILNLSDCRHLRYLPEELPWQTTSTDIADGGLLEPHRVILTGCESLDEDARRNIVEKTMMRMQHVANRRDEDFICPLTVILSGYEIPESFYRGDASSVAVELLTDSSTSTFRGLVIGVIADCGCTNIKFECTLKKADGSYHCSFEGKIDFGDTMFGSMLCLHYLPSGVIRDYCKDNLKDANHAAFRFRFRPVWGDDGFCDVQKCGIRLIYANHEV